MKTVAIVVRTLKEGKTYEDFRKAWYHTVGFGTPTRMYSLINAVNPKEVITIGIIETDLETLPSLVMIDAQQRESHPLSDVIEESIVRYFGVLVAEDDFSQAGSIDYQPAEIDGNKTDLNIMPHLLTQVTDILTKVRGS